MDLQVRLPHLFPPWDNLDFFGARGSKETLTNDCVGVGLGEVEMYKK